MKTKFRYPAHLAALAVILIASIHAVTGQTTKELRTQIYNTLPTNNSRQITAERLRSVFITSANAIDSVFKTISLANGIGTYNAATGLATVKESNLTYTLVATADQANGKYYQVVAAGTRDITGASVSMQVGGMVISRGTKWDYIPPSDMALQRALALEAKVPYVNLVNPATVQDNRTIFTNGTTGTNAGSAHTDFIPCLPGQVISYVDSVGSGATKVNFATAAQANISQIVSGVENTTTFTTPANCYFVRVTFPLSRKAKVQVQYGPPTAFVPYGQAELTAVAVPSSLIRQDASRRFVSDTEKNAYMAKLGPDNIFTEASKNLFDPSLAVDGSTINSNGTTQSNAAQGRSDFIACVPGQIFSYSDESGPGAGAVKINFATSARANISQITSGNGDNTATFTIPANCYFFRITYVLSRKSKIQVEVGSASSYEPFGQKLVSVMGAAIRPKAGDLVQTSTARMVTDSQIGTWNLKVDSDPYIVLPKTMYAVVGKEFNLYYDAFTMLPEYGPGTPNFLFDINCSVGKMDTRSFRITPTSGNVGDYSFKFRTYGSNTSLYRDFENVLKVVPASNPATVKHVLHFGDSTIDEGTSTKTVQENLAVIGGNVPIFHGQHHAAPFKNEGRSGNTYADMARGKVAHKIYFSGISPSLNTANIRNAYYTASGGSTRILLSERWQVNPDGTGWAIGYNPVGNFVPPTTFPATLAALDSKTTADGFPASITVTGIEALPAFSIFKDSEGVGALNIAYYRTEVLKMAAGDKFDAVVVEFGINDVFGLGIVSDQLVSTIVSDAKLLIAAFLADNPNCKIIIALPKSRSSDHYNSNRKQTMFRFSIHKVRARFLSEFDANALFPNVFVSQAGYGLDRFYSYPHSAKPISARSSETYISSDDDVHPNTAGYQQYADGLTGILLYVLKL